MGPQWMPHLQNVLTNHVIASEVPSSAVTDGLTADALSGEELTFTVNAEGVFVNENVKIVAVDVEASNGVIHAVDNVIVPTWVSNSIVDRASASDILTTLVDLVVKANLAETLSGPGPFTVFAPTDAAFVEFLNGADASALDIAVVTDVLTYHVVEGIYTASQVTDGLKLKTLQGEEITFTVADSGAMVNGENIVATDILANNGIVHVIDGVLTKPAPMEDMSSMKSESEDMSSTMEDETTMEKDSHDMAGHDMDDMKKESAGVARVATGAAAAFAAAVLLF